MQQYEYQKTTTSDNYRPVSPPPTTVQQYEYQKTTTSNNYRPITPPPTTVQQYEYQKTTTSNSYRPITPPPTTVQQYEYQKTTTNVREKPRTPPPHRSPSPVSFAQPPDPHVNQTIASYSTFEKGRQPALRRGTWVDYSAVIAKRAHGEKNLVRGTRSLGLMDL